MARVKRSVTKRRRKKRLLKLTKGYKWGRKSKYAIAKQAVLKAHAYSYRDRKAKKRDFRRLWQIKINAGVRQHGLIYSKFINLLKKNKIEIDRKILANLAENHPTVFEKIVMKIKG